MTSSRTNKYNHRFGAAGLAAMLLAAGCSTTVESQPCAAKAVESGGLCLLRLRDF